jgi:hypothetical protein
MKKPLIQLVFLPFSNGWLPARDSVADLGLAMEREE